MPTLSPDQFAAHLTPREGTPPEIEEAMERRAWEHVADRDADGGD